MADKNVQIGPGFMGCLTLIFIVLKLTSVINWSWWWVLSPLWIPLALVFVIALIAGLIAGVAEMLK